MQGYPGWKLCLRCTEDAGRGLILPIVSKEPLSDKKLKKKDYLGSVIFPILQLLPKTTSARPGDAGNQSIPWKKMVHTTLPESAQRGGVSVAKPPPAGAGWDRHRSLGCCMAPPATAGPGRGKVLHGSCAGAGMRVQSECQRESEECTRIKKKQSRISPKLRKPVTKRTLPLARRVGCSCAS